MTHKLQKSTNFKSSYAGVEKICGDTYQVSNTIFLACLSGISSTIMVKNNSIYALMKKLLPKYPISKIKAEGLKMMINWFYEPRLDEGDRGAKRKRHSQNKKLGKELEEARTLLEKNSDRFNREIEAEVEKNGIFNSVGPVSEEVTLSTEDIPGALECVEKEPDKHFWKFFMQES
ncbi:hypothetical protein ACJX0J_024084, partial [Zea mays]